MQQPHQGHHLKLGVAFRRSGDAVLGALEEDGSVSDFDLWGSGMLVESSELPGLPSDYLGSPGGTLDVTSRDHLPLGEELFKDSIRCDDDFSRRALSEGRDQQSFADQLWGSALSSSITPTIGRITTSVQDLLLSGQESPTIDSLGEDAVGGGSSTIDNAEWWTTDNLNSDCLEGLLPTVDGNTCPQEVAVDPGLLPDLQYGSMCSKTIWASADHSTAQDFSWIEPAQSTDCFQRQHPTHDKVLDGKAQKLEAEIAEAVTKVCFHGAQREAAETRLSMLRKELAAVHAELAELAVELRDKGRVRTGGKTTKAGQLLKKQKAAEKAAEEKVRAQGSARTAV